MLNATQLKSLRNANSVSFHHHDGNEHSEIVVHYGEDDCCETKITTATALVDYKNSVGYSVADMVKFWGFDMVHACKYCDEWKTIPQLLKVGDILTLKWVANSWHDNDTGFVGDRLYLEVVRGKKRFTFLVGDFHGPDNTARIVKRTATQYKIAVVK